MAEIDLISGAYDKSKSIPGTLWVIQADSTVLFEVKKWTPLIAHGDYGTSNAKAAIAQKITWRLKDKTGKDLFGVKETTVTEKMQFAINKRYAGSYPYQLHAQLDASNHIVNAGICGFCDANVTDADWSLKSKEKDQSEINYGHVIYFTLETEGINGDSLTIEIYDKNDPLDIPLTTLEAECINGIIKAEVETLLLHVKDESEGEEDDNKSEYYIKLKNLKGIYILQGGTEKMSPFTIRHKVIEPKGRPENVTLTTINPSEGIKMTPTGVIELEKVKVATTHTVRNDEFMNKEEDAWVLTDDGTEEYHWLRERKTEDDLGKPDPLPITSYSTDPFIITAYFTTIIEIDQAIIRVRDRKGKYTFPDKQAGSRAKGEPFEFEFKSPDSPYKNTVQYFPAFELLFEYSLDQGESWTPLDSVTFCLYLTWKKPYCDKFWAQERIPNNNYIPETLLWLGCANAKGLGNTHKDLYEDMAEIMDAIFLAFTGLYVVRRRENEIRANKYKKQYLRNNLEDIGLGYWRGNSDAINKFNKTPSFPTLKLLLEEYGEARCGHWSVFLQYIIHVQGGLDATQQPLLKPFDFETEVVSKNINYEEIPQINGENIDIANLQVYKGKVLMKDGEKKNKEEKAPRIPVKAGEKITAVFLVESPKGSWEINEGEPPKQLLGVAQGYTNTHNYAKPREEGGYGYDKPLHFFWDHAIAVLKKKVKGVDMYKYYDPSYGVSGTTYYRTHQEVLAAYTQENLKAVVAVEVAPTGGKRFRDTEHTKKWVPFAPKYTFEDKEENVPAFHYTYITKDMDKHLTLK